MHLNGITPPGIEALAKSFLRNPKLRIINLADNTCKKQGATALAEVEQQQHNIYSCLNMFTYIQQLLTTY